MEFHPFADVWPLMEGPEFDGLVTDIKTYGLRQAIVTYQQKILDGRNRYNACVTAGVSPRYEPAKVKSDEEAIALIVSLNDKRRHLNEAQRAMAAAKIATIKPGERTDLHTPSLDKDKVTTNLPTAAKLMNVGLSTVGSARTVLKHASPDVIKSVEQGKMSLNAAKKTIKPKEKKSQKKTRAEVEAANAAKAANHKPRQLTRKDVDPEFVGDEIAFVTEYGHVWMETSQERSTRHLTAWTIAMRHLARTLREQKLSKISPVMLSWLRKPKPADVESLQASLEELELAVATARDLLDRAQSIIAERPNGHDVKSHGGREAGA